MHNNTYTLITGAGEGLGKALAIECARRKMNLIVVALPGPEIFFLADLLKRNYGVDVIPIEKDLCADNSCTALFAEVAAMNIGVNMLINNAGVGSTVLFKEGDVELYEKQIKLNVLATTLLTRYFLEMLKKNESAYILNVGSMASFFCLPRKSVYGASKSFIYSFSANLRRELVKDKIYVSVLCPGGMNTNLALTLMNKSGNYISRLSIMDPEDVVSMAIDGLLKNKAVIIPGRLNRFFRLLKTIFPSFIKRRLSDHALKNLKPVNSFQRYLYEPVVSPISDRVA